MTGPGKPVVPPGGGTPLTPLGTGQAPRLKKGASLVACSRTDPRAATRHAPPQGGIQAGSYVKRRWRQASSRTLSDGPEARGEPRSGSVLRNIPSCGTSPRQASRKARSFVVPADQGGTGGTAKDPPRSWRRRHPELLKAGVKYPAPPGARPRRHMGRLGPTPSRRIARPGRWGVTGREVAVSTFRVRAIY